MYIPFYIEEELPVKKTCILRPILSLLGVEFAAIFVESPLRCISMMQFPCKFVAFVTELPNIT
jgi:hypothetical protein